jgi:DNA (cytosine-5)-methyltransferase 1
VRDPSADFRDFDALDAASVSSNKLRNTHEPNARCGHQEPPFMSTRSRESFGRSPVTGRRPARKNTVATAQLDLAVDSLEPRRDHARATSAAVSSEASGNNPLDVVGLFAGIGGIELGLHASGHRSVLLCEIEPAACRVLQHRFPDVPLHNDVKTLEQLPKTDLLVAGFPCQDLSQAGRTAGITGSRSGLVSHVFRLMKSSNPKWVMLENVPFMLQLDRGEAMRYLAKQLKSLGYRWAYRVVDSRSFGLPQRRQRVVLLASKTEDPTRVLFADEAGEPKEPADPMAYGFYWTEGLKGLGWAVEAVPTLKGGSTVGIPSPPAIWFVDTNQIATPDIRDAERLQGFPEDWTVGAVVDASKKNTPRWKLVGNAVSVPLARWVGERLREPGAYDGSQDAALRKTAPWPTAAWAGEDGIPRVATGITKWPRHETRLRMREFLQYPVTGLSERATEGFLSRTDRSTLRFDPRFIEALRKHLKALQKPKKSR